MSRYTLWITSVFFSVGSTVLAQPAPDYGLDWVTIGSSGNRYATFDEAPGIAPLRVGRVNHEYRLTRTEITAGQWFEFVEAYAPYYTGSRIDPAFTGLYIVPSTFDPLMPPRYRLIAGAENLPTEMSWRMAARYCNWLHNGKSGEAWAFESGAYDTSTFSPEDFPGDPTDQHAHSPGARYWIPSVNEWVKGMYYDPNRFGEGVEGYWQFPHSSDEPAIPGLPEEGGQTTGGMSGLFAFPVGAYPDVQSPWGLLDGSGGTREWTQGFRYLHGLRSLGGSFSGDPLYAFWDRLGWFTTIDALAPIGGIRLATTVPCPGSAVAGVIIFVFFRRNSR